MSKKHYEEPLTSFASCFAGDEVSSCILFHFDPVVVVLFCSFTLICKLVTPPAALEAKTRKVSAKEQKTENFGRGVHLELRIFGSTNFILVDRPNDLQLGSFVKIWNQTLQNHLIIYCPLQSLVISMKLNEYFSPCENEIQNLFEPFCCSKYSADSRHD